MYKKFKYSKLPSHPKISTNVKLCFIENGSPRDLYSMTLVGSQRQRNLNIIIRHHLYVHTMQLRLARLILPILIQGWKINDADLYVVGKNSASLRSLLLPAGSQHDLTFGARLYTANRIYIFANIIDRPTYTFLIQLTVTKGQLIQKCPFGVFKSSEKPMKFLPAFLPQPLKRGQIKKVV